MYQETPFVNPYVGSIADLITRPADARAAAIRAAGEAQARAAEISGQAYGGAIANAGQAAGQAITQLNDPQRLLVQQKADELKQQKAGRLSLSNAIKQYGDDHEAIAKAVTAQGFPDQANAWLKQTTENADNIAKLKGLSEQQAKAQRELIGDLAYTAKTPHDLIAGIGVLASTPGGGIDEQTAHRIADQIDADPSAFDTIKSQYQQFSPRYMKEQEELNKPITTPEGAITTTPARAAAGQSPLVTGAAKPKTPAEIALEAAGGDPAKAIALIHPGPNVQPEVVQTATGPQLVDRSAGTSKPILDANGQPVKAPIPAQIQMMNQPIPDVKLNDHEQGIAKQLASGDLTFSDFSKMYSSRAGAGQAVKEAIYAHASELNPEFSPAKFEAGYKFATNPQVTQRVVAINALAPVVDKITSLAAEAGNTDFPTVNRLLMSAKFQLGGKTITDLGQLQTILGDEVGNALGVGTGSDMKTRLGLDLVNTKLSPSNFLSTMQQLQTMLNSRKDQLLKGMGQYGKGDQAVPVAAPSSTPVKVGGFTVTVHP